MTSLSRPLDALPVGRYRIDPDASEVAFTVKHMFGLGTVRGRMSIRSGEIVVADDIGSSHATVTVAATSFDSGDPRRDRAVMAAKLLDVQRHPSMRFVSTAATRENDRWVVSGVLSAHGVEAPVRWEISDTVGDASGVTVRATGRVDRYEHGITAARGMAGRIINVSITAHAVRQTSAD